MGSKIVRHNTLGMGVGMRPNIARETLNALKNSVLGGGLDFVQSVARLSYPLV